MLTTKKKSDSFSMKSKCTLPHSLVSQVDLYLSIPEQFLKDKLLSIREQFANMWHEYFKLQSMCLKSVEVNEITE